LETVLLPGGGRLELVYPADIREETTDFIVNAAASMMEHVGGIARAIWYVKDMRSKISLSLALLLAVELRTIFCLSAASFTTNNRYIWFYALK
jgi:hypothetical protein